MALSFWLRSSRIAVANPSIGRVVDLFLQQLINGVAIGMGYALVALGLTLIFGVMHLINFAHGEFFMLGALVTVFATVYLGVPYGFAIPIVVVAMALAGWMVDKLAVRPFMLRADGTSTALLSTFAVSLLIENSVLGLWGPAPERVEGVRGVLQLGALHIAHQNLFLIVAGLLLIVGFDLLLRHSLFGMRMRAVAQSPFGALATGINIKRVQTSTFVTATVLAGLAGALVVPLLLFTPAMGQNVIINAFVIVVLGGMGSISGAVVCGVLLGVLESLTSIILPQQVAAILIYGLMLVMLLLWPKGLFARGGAR